MKTTLLTLLSIALSGCFYSGMDDDYQRIDPKLRPHVDQFVSEASARGVSIDISSLKMVIGDAGKDVGGITYYQDNRIIIDSTVAEESLERIIFHEMGHLYLHRGHRNEMVQNGIRNEIVPISIMNCCAPVFNYQADRIRYIDELFSVH